MAAPATEKHIEYAFAEAPAAGDSAEVANGITWLRMPLPFALSHINLWLLSGDGRCTIVDTGIGDADSRTIWRRVIADVRTHARIERVLVTHLHPDHSGNAGWLCGELDVGLCMTREEYLLCRVLTADTGRQAPSAGIDFYRGAGFPEHALDRYQKMFGMFGRFVAELPESYTRLRDADVIDISGTQWEVIVGRGHSPEHACLFNAADNVLISGDQLLPTISSNVSVFPTEPLANPLAEWLTSLRGMKTRIPADVLVLPAHGRPFRGAHRRLDALVAEHEASLDALLTLCREPRRAVDTFPALFKSTIKDSNLIMATGESVAHLNYLIDEGVVARREDADGVRWYQSVV